MPLSFTIVKYHLEIMSQCCARSCDLFYLNQEGLARERDEPSLRQAIALLVSARRLVIAREGGPAVQMVHARWRARRCAGPTYIRRLDGRAGDILGITRSPSIQAVASGAEMRNLQEATNNHDVLEKMDHLISVGKVMVKEDRRCQREHRKARRHFSHTKTKDQQQPAANLKGNGNCPAQRSQGQTHAADVGCRRSEGSELAEAAHEERKTDKYATK